MASPSEQPESNPEQADIPQTTTPSDDSSQTEASSLDTPDSPEETKISRMERILSMKAPIIVKVAEKKMTMDKILQFHIGSIIQFDKDAYQHIDLMVNNHTIGLGQPVKIGENFGLRITQIADITETIKSLGVTDQS